MSLVWQSVSKWEIRPIAPKFSLIAAFPRAGEASPSPTAGWEGCAIGRRVGVSATLQGKPDCHAGVRYLSQ